MAAKKQRLWYIDKLGKMGIVEKVTNGVTRDGYKTDWTSITEVKATRIYAISRDSDISIDEMTNTFNQIPGEYHEALVYKVIAMGYKDPRHMDLQVAQYFDGEFAGGVKAAKTYSRSSYQTTGTIRQQDY